MTAPVPRPPSTGRSERLAAVIRAEISSSSPSSPSSEGRITFRRYMELALYHPELGYYRALENRPTRGGDFLTAPETNPIFGWTLARWLERQWEELGRPVPFRLVEYGAGSGTLALTLFDGLRRHERHDLLDALRYSPVETNPYRMIDLTTRFEAAGLAGHLDVPGAPTEGAGASGGIGSVPVFDVLVANEFLDALPVHRVAMRDGALRELFVAWRDRFVEIAGEPSTPSLAARLAGEGIALSDGQSAEICLELDAWFGDVSTRMRPGGARALLLDYGFEAADLYGPRHRAGTLLGYRGHQVVDHPLLDPGDVDLTAHVDFTAVRGAAARVGFVAEPLATQAEFLLASGLEAEWQALRSPETTAGEYAAARSAILRLLDPRKLGGFRALQLRR